MGTYGKNAGGETVFVGIDLHRRTWHVTARTIDRELFTIGIAGNWEALERVLIKIDSYDIKVVYEAGYFGFWLQHRLTARGLYCIVTPPSLIPQEYGNRVKTDRKDSRKLAHLLAKDLLKEVYVPSEEELFHRQVLRRRTQLIQDRVRTQNRIKAELRFYGIDIPSPRGKWTLIYMNNLKRIRFGNRWIQESFNRLIEQYEFLSIQIQEQTRLLLELAKEKRYQERVEILTSIPGIGVLTAMELLLELIDMERFSKPEQLAAYVGLTPAQYSSGDKVRMGRITGIGKSHLRATLVEASWYLITRDDTMREVYDRIKSRAGGKRAVVGVARRLLLVTRRMLKDGQLYQKTTAA
jgi:transposase